MLKSIQDHSERSVFEEIFQNFFFPETREKKSFFSQKRKNTEMASIIYSEFNSTSHSIRRPIRQNQTETEFFLFLITPWLSGVSVSD